MHGPIAEIQPSNFERDSPRTDRSVAHLRPRTLGRVPCGAQSQRHPNVRPFKGANSSTVSPYNPANPVTSLLADGLATLRDENRRLRALVDFGRQVTAERDLRAQLRLLCTELLRTTGCSAAAVILHGSEHGAIES